MPVMNTNAGSARHGESVPALVHQAMDAVDMALAGLPRTQLSPAARDELALDVAALMGRLEWLLSLVRREGSAAMAPAAPRVRDPS
jgi:hypothetical protein